ncbi:hypothetical protein [Sulfitobacter donghicola]|nr:hypothetical protein [Sulfitobacter donghicola]
MLAQEGETITYVLCTGGGFETVTVPLHEDGSGTADEWCDFYSVLVPALPFGAPDVAPIQLEVARLSVIVPVQLHAALVGLPPFSSRAPPLFG